MFFRYKFNYLLGYILCIISIVRGLFVFDMGLSAKTSYPVASAICLGAGVIAYALLSQIPEEKKIK